MSKKTFTILILALVVIVGVFAFFYFSYVKPAAPTTQTTPTTNDDLFPFGNGGGGQQTGGGSGASAASTTKALPPRLRQLSLNPLAGVASLTRDSKTHFRYIERATGHIFETPADSLDITRITNTTVPKIYEAQWGVGAGSILLRYLKDDEETINTFYASFGSASTTQTANLNGTFLAPNIGSTVFSPLGTSIAYTVTHAGASLYTADTEALKPKLIFVSPLREWLLLWPEKNTLTLTTRASAGVDGFMYAISPTTGASRKILSSVKGLTTLMSPDGKKVLYAGNENGSIELHLLTISGNVDVGVPFTTLPEKCVWSEKSSNLIFCAVPKNFLDSTLPDTWYQGKVSFDDALWSYDTITGTTVRLLDPSTYSQSFDMVAPSLSANENFILFINKKNLLGWTYKLTP